MVQIEESAELNAYEQKFMVGEKIDWYGEARVKLFS